MGTFRTVPVMEHIKRTTRYRSLFFIILSIIKYLFGNNITMAKSSKSAGNSNKVTFGKKGTGKAQKSHNKHDRKERNYRGQGR